MVRLMEDTLWITRNRVVKNRLKKQSIIDNRPTFYKMFQLLGGVRIYITRNIRLRQRGRRDSYDGVFNRTAFRKHVYERSGHRCEICGKELTWETQELHHILPISKFPQFAMDERNMQCLCRSCHKSIHCDPYKSIRQMEWKAKELDVKLEDYYEVYGDTSEN